MSLNNPLFCHLHYLATQAHPVNQPAYIAVDTICDIFFIGDLLLCSRLAYFKHTSLVTSADDILHRYSRTLMPFHLLSIVPPLLGLGLWQGWPWMRLPQLCRVCL